MTSGEHEQHGADGSGAAGGADGPGPAGGPPGRPEGGVPRSASRSGPRRGPDDDLTGRLLGGRYRVTGRIGRGGMGVVCRAEDQVLGREVALKVLRAYTDASAPELADLRTRMQREARAAARIRHSGVVTVHDVIDEAGRPVIVMELVDGPSLDDALGAHGPLDPRQAARIGAAVMDALDAAHQAGVLHRDVKPGNVLLEGWGRPGGGRVVLTDFGIASIEAPGDGASTNITRSGELVGSLDYLPPERAQGMDPTPASDIWSLGMTLYAAVEGGGAPFRRTSVYSTLTAIVTEPLPAPRRAGPLTPVLYALMAKSPADRPSAAQARSMLQAVADGRDPGAALPPPAPASGTPYAPTQTDATSGAGPLPRPAAPWTAPPGVATGPGGAFTGPVGQVGPNAAAPHGSSPGPGTPGPFGPYPPGPSAPTGPTGPTAPLPGATGPHRPYPHPGPGPETARVPVRRPRRVVLAAAAALAVLAAGGGITYALIGGGSGGRDTAGGRQPAVPATTPGATAGKGGTAGDGKANGSSASGPATPSHDASPSGSPGPGGPGGQQGGRNGGATTGGGQGGAGTGGGTTGGTTGGSGAAAGGATGGGGPTHGPACVDIGGGKANCDVWRTAASYTASFQQVGHLNIGTNYFYCQAKLGRRETYGKWTNVWWARTDDDSGNSGVYVSVVYLTGGDNDQPVPGLRTC
ncbi:protein kinase [Streptomyces sp. RS10V-4]|uniref:serine/threonine-protein kinase n=1 Tax=Streptomyces rhizoryzae TaxID=2932493 RepID=UPI002004D99E|nr:serine/threonine-protein kinase [Streptomyces rhizoryzae]MCK7622667.1 protein kinase [Streptomyces rhizoryzae]